MWHYDEPEDGVLIVRIDRDGRPVNSFSIETMNQLRDVAQFVASRDDVRVVLFESAKRGNFIAGADLYEIRENATYDATLKMARNGQSAFQAIEELEATTVAVINGVALGGGLEFAMACDFRVAADDARTFFGLPEVHLGLMPGFGATVRTPRLVGLRNAMQMLLDGSHLSPATALEFGLVDRVADAKNLRSVATELAQTGTPRRVDELPTPEAIALLGGLRERQQARTRGHYPSPVKMIEVMAGGLGKSEEDRYELEAQGIATLAPDPVTEQLIRLFFLKEAAKKPPAELKDAAKAFELKRVGVVADGPFGERIAATLAKRQLHTQLAQLGEVDAGLAAASFEKLDRGADLNDIADANLVIEAIPDDLEAERGMFQQLGIVLHPEAVIASTSSAFLLREQTDDLPQPGRLVGIRFCEPVETGSLLEVVRSETTSDVALGAAYSLARRLGRQTVLVQDSPGFLVNRMLLPYLVEAAEALVWSDDADTVERTMAEFGMERSPFVLTDGIGLSVISSILKRLHTEADEHTPMPALWRAILDSGETTLTDENGTLRAETLAAAEKLRAESPNPVEIPPDQLVARLVYPMINTGARCLASGVVATADDIDLAMILADSFPAFRGGPMQFARTVGVAKIIEQLTEFANAAARFAPCQALVDWA